MFILIKKIVRESFGTAYLAILESLNEKFLEMGLTKKQLPKSVEGYREMMRRYLKVHNGKLLKEFEMLYDALHIAGYYRGLIYNVKVVNELLEASEKFIKKVLK